MNSTNWEVWMGIIYVVGIPLCGVYASFWGSRASEDWPSYLLWPVWVVMFSLIAAWRWAKRAAGV